MNVVSQININMRNPLRPLYFLIPFNVNGGRPCNMYRDISLTDGLFISGNYMNTGSLNGALESGKLAAIATSKFLQPIS